MPEAASQPTGQYESGSDVAKNRPPNGHWLLCIQSHILSFCIRRGDWTRKLVLKESWCCSDRALQQASGTDIELVIFYLQECFLVKIA